MAGNHFTGAEKEDRAEGKPGVRAAPDVRAGKGRRCYAEGERKALWLLSVRGPRLSRRALLPPQSQRLPLPGPHEAAWLPCRRGNCGDRRRREDTPADRASGGIRAFRATGRPLLKVAPFTWRLGSPRFLTRAKARKKPGSARRRLRSLRSGAVGRRREYQRGRFACSWNRSRRSNQQKWFGEDASTAFLLLRPC